jgi:hypothetical protein
MVRINLAAAEASSDPGGEVRARMATKRKTRLRIDQLTVQEAVRVAARRCAVWGRDIAAGRCAVEEDQAFVDELVRLVRRYERARPTGEGGLRPSDRGLEQRLIAVVEDLGAAIKARKRRFGAARPGKAMFLQLARTLQRHGFDVTWDEVQRAFTRMVALKRPEEQISDLSKDFSGSAKEAARECVGALDLDAAVSSRNLHLRERRASAELPSDRRVHLDELARYFLACIAVGPHAANALAEAIVIAYRGSRLDPRWSPGRELLAGFFAEPSKPRPAYPPDRRRARTGS